MQKIDDTNPDAIKSSQENYEDVINGKITLSGNGTLSAVCDKFVNNVEVTVTGTITLNFTNLRDYGVIYLIIKQDGTGGHALTWDENIKWGGGSAPTISAGANEIDTFVFQVMNNTMYASPAVNVS